MSTTTARRSLIQAAIAIFLFGTSPIAIKFTSANVYTIGIFRLAVALLFTALLLCGKNHLRFLTRQDWFALVLIGLIFAVHWFTYFLSIKLSSASIAAIGSSSYGIHLILLSWFYKKTKLIPANLIAVAVALIGNLLVVPEYSLNNQATVGLLLGIVSGFSYALLPIVHQRYSHIHSTVRTFGQFAFAFILFLFFLPSTNWALSSIDWYSLAYLSIFSTIIAHSLWVRATTTLATNTTSVIYYGYVPVALLLSYFILGEELSLRVIVGAVLIICASIFGLKYQVKSDSVLVEP